MNFGERLVKAREKLGFNQSCFAEKINLAAQSLARYEKNKTVPSMDFITKLTNLFSINSNWLLTGKGSMLLKDSGNVDLDNGYSIDVLNIKASAGAGIEHYLVETIDTIMMDKSLFRTPVNPKNIKCIQVDGDSMEPTLRDDDYVLIDTSSTRGIDGIYAIQLHNQILIKRLEFNLDGTISIISDNPKYQTKIYNPDETQIPLQIIGIKRLAIQR